MAFNAGLLAFLKDTKAVHRFLIGLAVSLPVYYISTYFILTVLARMMLAWDSFCVVQIVIAWYIFANSNNIQTHEQAKKQDESRTVMFFLILFIVFAGLLAILLLLTDKTSSQKTIDAIVAFLGMFLNWFLMHTVFTIRYAHLYYGNKPQSKLGGLYFPQNEEPDFLDFAYYALTVGMTFQVSDVSATSKKMRRLTLLHGVISFVFNTVIVALTIDVIADIAA